MGQISINLLRDEELVSLIAESGGKWIFIGLESIDPENLKSVRKGFNKPDEYGDILALLARHRIYAITSFIFGMDGDRPGIAQHTLRMIRSWPPGLPVFGLLTPYPGTPLYDRLAAAGRLSRPQHWLEFKPFVMDYTPLGISSEQAEAVQREIGYFTRNKHRMEYGQFRARGLMIGSGPVEAGCKTVVGTRLKRAGSAPRSCRTCPRRTRRPSPSMCSTWCSPAAPPIYR